MSQSQSQSQSQPPPPPPHVASRPAGPGETARGAARQSETSLQLGCGIGWRTELAASWARRRADGPQEQAIGLQAKTSLREGGHSGLGWALVCGVEGVSRPGGALGTLLYYSL